ncbi:D-alanyl-D-alanine carboxypeptidase family protein [Turicibacter sanguinis]|nr:M15 family metallopeptidase [Turicibacter sanguinis]
MKLKSKSYYIIVAVLSLIGIITVIVFISPSKITKIENMDTVYPNVTGNFYKEITVVKFPKSLNVLVNKNYRLPDNYEPDDLVLLDVPLYRNNTENEGNYMREEAAEALKSLFSEAEACGYTLIARSGYRSYATQVQLYNRYVSEDGVEAADTYSARPGHSEHQTGLTIDITSPVVNNDLTESFGDTSTGKWVRENAHRFGFIIRYPEDRVSDTGYQYEPWHLRYVGIEVATQIYNQNWILEDYLMANDLISQL